MVKIHVQINPAVNLFYHLERGGLSKRYIHVSPVEYRCSVLKITDKVLLDSFSFLLNQENLHSVIVKRIKDSKSPMEAKRNLTRAMNIYASELADIIHKAWPDYLQHFKENVKPQLEEFENKLRQIVPEIEGALNKLERLLGLRWKKEYNIYIIEPTSEYFKPCGDAIYDDGAVVEAHLDLKTNDLVDLITHELAHSTFDPTILGFIPENLRKDFEYVDEAIIFLIVDTAMNYLKEPPDKEQYQDERSKKTAFYTAKFWERWQKRIGSVGKKGAFEDFLSNLLADNS